MKYADVAENVKKLVETPPPKDEFIFELLPANGNSGQANLAKEPSEVLLKKKVWFKKVEQASRLPHQDKSDDPEQAGRSLYVAIEKMKTAKAVKTMAQLYAKTGR